MLQGDVVPQPELKDFYNMNQHVLTEHDGYAIGSMIGNHRVELASGKSFDGKRKHLCLTLLGEFIVDLDGEEKWHGKVLLKAIEAYNDL